MKCHYCGEEVAENQSYCMWCGTRKEPAEAPATREPVCAENAVPVCPEPREIPVQEQPAPVYREPKPAAAEPDYVPRNSTPQLQLPTARGLGKMIFLGILTLGIYPIVIWSRIVTELNIAASRYDGKRTMPYFAMVMLAPVTLGVYAFVWMHKFCGRIGAELDRRGLDCNFGPKTFWLWNILGSLIVVGPFIFVHKLMKAMNKINEDFNTNG